jgi:hypothetical protein
MPLRIAIARLQGADDALFAEYAGGKFRPTGLGYWVFAWCKDTSGQHLAPYAEDKVTLRSVSNRP